MVSYCQIRKGVTYMSKYIYSKWSDKDLLVLSATNLVADMYEMVGLYVSFSENAGETKFYDYYLENVNLHPYHFKNIGERRVKESLRAKQEYIPRRNFRFLSRTWTYVPVVASDDINVIFSELIDIIYSIEELKKVFLAQQWELTPNGIFGFQHMFLQKYLMTKAQITSVQKHQLFSQAFFALKSNRVFK